MTSDSKLETRFSALIQNLQEAVLVEDENRKILLVNETFCKMFGYEETPSDLIGYDCSNAAEEAKPYFKNPDDFVERIEEVLAKRKIVIADELEMVNGVYLERDYVPVFMGKEYAGHLWKYRDVTKQKVLIREILQMQQKAETTNKELDEFTSIVSHDLKAPLRAIYSLAGFIEEDLKGIELPDDVPNNFGLLKQRVHTMSNFIDTLLEYSKVGRSEAKDQKIDIKELLGSIESMLNHEKEHEIELPDDSIEIQTNRTTLYQVLQNLIQNAIVHNIKTQVKISVRWAIQENHIEFTVSDNGPGIDPKHHDRIFRPFYRVNANKEKNNSGIGLAIVKKLVRENGGNISVESDGKNGTSFIVKWLL